MAKSGPRYMFGKVNNKILPAEIRIIDDVQAPRNIKELLSYGQALSFH